MWDFSAPFPILVKATSGFKAQDPMNLISLFSIFYLPNCLYEHLMFHGGMHLAEL